MKAHHRHFTIVGALFELSQTNEDLFTFKYILMFVLDCSVATNSNDHFIVEAGKCNTGRGSDGPHTKRGKRDELS